ncbi:MAG: hypothetical protein VX438_13325 [Planctomycetota bacterium]|nr:hypothetical protein [Planctomycetota bacterium]
MASTQTVFFSPDKTYRIYNPAEPVIFTHIPKCAGTSFIRVLRFWFKETYCHLIQDESKDIKLPKVGVQLEDGSYRQDIKCIHGHFNHGRGYGLPYHYPEINQYITIMRDPFDIVVSMYFFFKGKSLRGEFFHRGKQIDVRDQFPSVEHYVRNYPDWLFDHLPQNISLENVEEQIRKRFIYVGLFEEMQTSIDVLSAIFGKKTMDMPKKNVSNYDEAVPERLRDKFYYDFPLLLKIYQFVKNRYRAPIKDLNLDLESLQRKTVQDN